MPFDTIFFSHQDSKNKLRANITDQNPSNTIPMDDHLAFLLGDGRRRGPGARFIIELCRSSNNQRPNEQGDRFPGRQPAIREGAARFCYSRLFFKRGF